MIRGTLRSIRPAAALLAGALFLAPAPILAQVCLGSPTEEGQFSLSGEGNLTDRGNDFGVSAEANLPGPLALRGGVQLEEADNDDRVARFEGRVSYDIRSNGISICPVTGADYSSRTVQDESVSTIRIPVGVSVGGRIALAEDGPSLIPSARAGVAHRRISGTGETITDNSLFVIGGGSISIENYFVRGEAGIESTEGSEPFYRLSVGVRF